MACFVAPAGVAVVTTIIKKVVEKRELAAEAQPNKQSASKAPGKWVERLGWLNLMLWGGTLMLVLDHLIAGELVPWSPFLTALETPGQASALLKEIAITGGAMTAGVFVVWAIMVIVVEARAKAKLARQA